MLLGFVVAGTGFIFSLRSNMDLNKKLYNENPLFAYAKVDFFDCPQARASSAYSQRKKPPTFVGGFPSSGNRTRTCDLRVMSPTSYLLLYPAI